MFHVFQRSKKAIRDTRISPNSWPFGKCSSKIPLCCSMEDLELGHTIHACPGQWNSLKVTQAAELAAFIRKWNECSKNAHVRAHVSGKSLRSLAWAVASVFARLLDQILNPTASKSMTLGVERRGERKHECRQGLRKAMADGYRKIKPGSEPYHVLSHFDILCQD